MALSPDLVAVFFVAVLVDFAAGFADFCEVFDVEVFFVAVFAVFFAGVFCVLLVFFAGFAAVFFVDAVFLAVWAAAGKAVSATDRNTVREKRKARSQLSFFIY
ncbi:hypothetical protein LJC19_00635 [Oxalobacter sp. OttesenSCG-928-P03]|nr:hypothetical protein [Oxalobacter sp. OttesenSCG-928-P03]